MLPSRLRPPPTRPTTAPRACRARHDLSPTARRRLDTELVRRGLVQSRSQAEQALDAGRVLVNGALADKPSRLVAPGDQIMVTKGPPRFVSRGGEKLDAALEHFRIDVSDRTALDAGASTGGFTDCLLRRGAARVISLDVGRGQLHPRIRGDDRVCVLERTNIRLVDPERLSTLVRERRPDWHVPARLQVSLATADLSFISLRTVAPVLAGGLLEEGGDLVALVKPQFEAGRSEAGKGKGVIRDPATWREAVVEVASAFEAAGAGIMDAMSSPLRGPAGNREFLLHARSGRPGRGRPELERMAEIVVDLPTAEPGA